MKLKRFSAIMSLGAVLVMGGVPADAGDRWAGRYAASDQNTARDAVRSGRVLPLGQVLRGVRATYPGRLLDANLIEQGGRPVYRIKILSPDGNVTVVTSDARTGRILGARRGGR